MTSSFDVPPPRKRVWIVAAHFPPSNLASVHRARLFANYLSDQQWSATVLTAHPSFYEETLDANLEQLVHPSVNVVRTRAIPAEWSRFFGIGDLGLRVLPFFMEALDVAVKAGEVDLLHLTIPSNYQALLGRWIWERYRIPYIVDYIDPWISERADIYDFPSKEWFSNKIAALLEPVATARASGLMGITTSYYSSVIRRNPGMGRVPHCALQYGISWNDFDAATKIPPKHLSPGGSHRQLVYAGAMLPRADVPMRALLRGIAEVNRTSCRAKPIRLVCLGTGFADKGVGKVSRIAQSIGAADCVREFPERHSYLEVLATLMASDGVVIVGSTEPHYSPSKLFQAVLARRPLLALLHDESEAASILKKTDAGWCVTFGSEPDEAWLGARCRVLLSSLPVRASEVNWEAFQPYLAESIAAELVSFYEEVLKFHQEENV